MCLMFLMCLSLNLVIRAELLLVRCNDCSISCLKRHKQGLAKGQLGPRPATHTACYDNEKRLRRRCVDRKATVVAKLSYPAVGTAQPRAVSLLFAQY